MLKPHLKIPTKSKVMQVSKLCKLAYKPCPHYCFERVFSKSQILCSASSKQLKTAQLSCYMQMLYFIISFSANKVINNVKINDIY